MKYLVKYVEVAKFSLGRLINRFISFPRRENSNQTNHKRDCQVERDQMSSYSKMRQAPRSCLHNRVMRSMQVLGLFGLLAACESNKVESVKIEPSTYQLACQNYIWGNRGIAPLGYLRGIAEAYKQNCTNETIKLGDSDHDALSYYGQEPSNFNIYAFLIGLGMRESSGKYCEGRDLSAINTTAETAESGMFQFSYNSISFNPKLKEIFEYYKAHKDLCLLDVFSNGVTCSQGSETVYGVGEGATFQKLARECPAFAVKYASYLIRFARKHFGPINRREVEFNESCQKYLGSLCQK